jgi:hypothetical protein
LPNRWTQAPYRRWPGHFSQQLAVSLSLLERHRCHLIGVSTGFNKLLPDLSDFALSSGHDNLLQGLDKL